MSAQIVDRTESGFTLQITIPYNRSMLDFEETSSSNSTLPGSWPPQEGLRQFDTDGSPITIGSVKLTSKGQRPKDYQTPYGVATVERHVYQSSQGGATYCPLDRDARIVVSSTPQVRQDGLQQVRRVRLGPRPARPSGQPRPGRLALPGPGHRRRRGHRGLGQGGGLELPPAEVGDPPGDRRPEPGRDLHADVRGRLAGDDGRDDQLLRPRGERQHTIYLAATPEYGKATFLGRLEAEVARVKAEAPRRPLRRDRRWGQGELGVPGQAHRAPGGGLLACGGVPGQGGGGAVPGPTGDPPAWMDDSCHTLKHDPGGAAAVLKQLKSLAKVRPWAKDDEDVQRAITYFENQSGAGRMDYAARVAANEPIGSGVTEAACKVIVKQRLCGSGMKWKEPGAAAVLSLRCLSHTPERWGQFWAKIDRWGFPVAA